MATNTPTESEINPPTGWSINKAAKTDIVNVTNGVINKSKTSGTIFLHCFSIKTANTTTKITDIIPPRPGVNSLPNKTILESEEEEITPPKAPPIIGIWEPNSFAALTPTKIDNTEKTEFPISDIILAAVVNL